MYNLLLLDTVVSCRCYPGCGNVIDLPHLFTSETANRFLFQFGNQMETGTLCEFMYLLDQFTIESLLANHYCHLVHIEEPSVWG